MKNQSKGEQMEKKSKGEQARILATMLIEHSPSDFLTEQAYADFLKRDCDYKEGQAEKAITYYTDGRDYEGENAHIIAATLVEQSPSDFLKKMDEPDFLEGEFNEVPSTKTNKERRAEKAIIHDSGCNHDRQ